MRAFYWLNMVTLGLLLSYMNESLQLTCKNQDYQIIFHFCHLLIMNQENQLKIKPPRSTRFPSMWGAGHREA